MVIHATAHLEPTRGALQEKDEGHRKFSRLQSVNSDIHHSPHNETQTHSAGGGEIIWLISIAKIRCVAHYMKTGVEFNRAVKKSLNINEFYSVTACRGGGGTRMKDGIMNRMQSRRL
jgi:hypothetical protein